VWKIARWPLVSAATVVLALPLSAQDALSGPPSHCVVRSGDDLRWAEANLDESAWQPASQWVEASTGEPHFWLRCKLIPAELAPSIRPVLQVAGDAAYEIFLDGRLLARFGKVNNGSHTVGVVNQYESPALYHGAPPVELAVRIAYSPTLYGQQALPWILIGDAGQMRNSYDARVWNAVRSRWIVWLCNAIMAAAGLFFITLYFFDRSQRLLLWASLTWLGLAMIRFGEFLIAASVHFPSRLEYSLYAIGNTEQIFYALFFFALAGRRVPTFFRALLAINAISTVSLIIPIFLPLRQSMAWRYWVDVSPQFQSIFVPVEVLIAFAPLAAFWPINKLSRSQLALYFVCSFWMGTDVLYLGVQFPWLRFGTYFFLSLQSVRSVSIAAVVVAMTVLLIQRIRNTNRERAALSAEMRAAQEIQRILVPQRIESAPGFEVEAVFLPAQEVGGDFYRFRVLEDGTQWMLLGDVSGKGVAAGMTGAMLLGACEGHTGDSPAVLLEHLNRVLCNSHVGGFATCLCARIEQDGTVVLANAGHLAPYLDRREIRLENGLPLGLTPDVSYLEESLQLASGDALTFLSDGVVEAQDASGELFGFDRTQALSGKPAAEIADVAQRFGQLDDITVLRVSFAAASPALALDA
jgi:sigma-B regulation protein RsbU (phosphoserine phosphatase)